jgi:hypothetical protein
MNYELELKEQKVKPHQSTALHLLVAFTICISGAIVLFLYKLFKFGLRSTDNPQSLKTLEWSGTAIIIAGIILVGIIIFKNKWLKKKKVNAAFRVIELLALMFFAGFTLMQQIIIPAVTYGILIIALLIAMFWENSNTAVKVYIDDQGIRMPFHTKRRFIAWPEIEKVMLRFGVLTIDCLDNKLYQWNVKNNELNTDSFEKYCDEKIDENKHKRREDW